MATVTHLPPRCNALRIKDKLLAHQTPKRACSGCGQDFQLTRSWQKHCSTRRRVRVHRQLATVQGYYGA